MFTIDRLLDLISFVLCGQMFKHPGSQRSSKAVSMGNRQFYVKDAAIEPDTPAILLALQTLGSFNFKGIILLSLTGSNMLDHNLIDLIKFCSFNFLDNDSYEIRKAAIETCCKLLANSPIIYQVNNDIFYQF